MDMPSVVAREHVSVSVSASARELPAWIVRELTASKQYMPSFEQIQEFSSCMVGLDVSPVISILCVSATCIPGGMFLIQSI